MKAKVDSHTPDPPTLTLIRAFRESGFKEKMAVLIAGWFFSGLFPKAPGTFATLCAVPLVLGFGALSGPFKMILFVVLTCLAVWSSGKTRDLLRDEDPSQVVIDEVVGYGLTMFFLPISWEGLMLGFFLFRGFDILKPYPIRLLEKGLAGGMGIVADDLAAGIYAGISGMIIRSLFL